MLLFLLLAAGPLGLAAAAGSSVLGDPGMKYVYNALIYPSARACEVGLACMQQYHLRRVHASGPRFSDACVQAAYVVPYNQRTCAPLLPVTACEA